MMSATRQLLCLLRLCFYVYTLTRSIRCFSTVAVDLAAYGILLTVGKEGAQKIGRPIAMAD